MANEFKRYKLTATTSETVAYQVPSLTTSVIVGLQAANTTTTQETLSILHGTTYLAKNVNIPFGAVMHFLDGKIVAEAGDTISVIASSGSTLDIIISCMETS
tara:strand:- start:1909 stop:2214 length:306 start_codon:yes stop_codon:yes gene_type:complete